MKDWLKVIIKWLDKKKEFIPWPKIWILLKTLLNISVKLLQKLWLKEKDLEYDIKEFLKKHQ